MSEPFNEHAVIEKAPSALLQQFLSLFPAFSGFDWTSPSAKNINLVLQHIRAADERDQRLIDIRFRQLHALANTHGTTLLISVAREAGFDVGEQLSAKRNAFERAFWCLVEHPALFDTEKIFAYTHSLPKVSKETRCGFPQGRVIVNEETVADLTLRIKAVFKNEKRGQDCHVDHRVHNGIHLFTANPADYGEDVESWLPNGEFSTVSVRPPIRVAIYLDESTGAVTILAKGGTEKHESLFEAFAQAVFHSDPPRRAGKKTYDLSIFKNPNYELTIDPADHFTRPRVVWMKLQFPESRYHKATFEVNPKDPTDNIYDKLRKKLRGGFDELTRATIESVELQTIFNVPGEAEEVVQFRTTVPRWCTLDHEGKEGIVRRHLKPWGVETDGKRVAVRPGPALVA